ncbi:MAG: glycosyltransferase family 4 protein [Elusimicrobiota bacterium]
MRIKVVHVITRLDYGGAQQNTLHTVSALDPNRFAAYLVCGRGGRLDQRTAALARREMPVPIRFIDDLVREVSPLRDLIALLKIYRLLREIRPAIVHTHSSKAGVVGRLAARLAGVPVILHTFHGFGFHERMPALLRAFFIMAERAVAACSTRLIFVSRANMDYARECGIGDADKYRLIRSGVRLADLPAPLSDAEEKRQSIGAQRGTPLVVSVGNMKPQKNCGDFLKVAQEVCRGASGACFVFVGDGPLRREFAAEIESRGLRGRVVLLGWRDDVKEILAAADVFLLTSLWEGLPRALVEAMKSGLPCVAYAVDGVRDVLRDGENGYAVAPEDWKRAADRVSELLGSRDLRVRLGKAAADSIGSEFDIDEMVRRQQDLYQELAG